ncbi:unnamed protein product [Sphacelaria rigidula]
MLSVTGVERSYAAAISDTMQNLSIRAEVGAVMESLLGDLEAWEWANKEEALRVELEHAKAQVAVLKASEAALLKREKIAAVKAEEDKAAAKDVRAKFVQELWGLAREFRLREQEQAKADQLSKKLARLEGVEASLQKAERKLATLQQAPMPTTRPATINTNSALPPTGTATGSKRGSSPRLPIYTQGGAGQLVGGSAPAGMTSGPELSPEMENERAAGTAGVQGGDDSESGGESCPFLELEKKPLLKVFVFLSAPEVLRAAQVCRSMFRKVDLMFGIGSQAVAATAPVPPESGLAERRSGGGVVAGGARDRAGSTTSTSSLSNPASAPTGLGQRTLANAFGAVASRVEAVTAGASGGLGVFAGAAASLTGGGGTANGIGGGDGVGGAGTISAEFVEGLSKKLTTAEMKGIIQLTERGRRLDARASTLQAEKEDLNARLQGTESVKEFLVSKLKETEAALKRSLDERGLTLRQSASDQEVISFLDSRTQVLTLFSEN